MNKKSRRVSVRQLNVLWEFLNSHRELATSYNRSLQAKEYSSRRWKDIADTLNALGDGVHKDWRGWSKYWVDFKAKIKKRVAAVRASRNQTGGGPSTEPPLSEIELKYLQVLGVDFGQGLPGVQVDPFIELSHLSMEVEVQDSPLSESILLPLNAAAVLEAQNPPVSQSHPIPPLYLPHSITPGQIISPTLSPNRTRTPSPYFPLPSTPATAAAAVAAPATAPFPCTPLPSTLTYAAAAAAPATARQSPARRRRRRDPPMSQEAARRALVQSSQMKAEAAVRSVAALEDIRDSVRIMQRILSAAFPRVDE